MEGTKAVQVVHLHGRVRINSKSPPRNVLKIPTCQQWDVCVCLLPVSICSPPLRIACLVSIPVCWLRSCEIVTKVLITHTHTRTHDQSPAFPACLAFRGAFSGLKNPFPLSFPPLFALPLLPVLPPLSPRCVRKKQEKKIKKKNADVRRCAGIAARVGGAGVVTTMLPQLVSPPPAPPGSRGVLPTGANIDLWPAFLMHLRPQMP